MGFGNGIAFASGVDAICSVGQDGWFTRVQADANCLALSAKISGFLYQLFAMISIEEACLFAPLWAFHFECDKTVYFTWFAQQCQGTSYLCRIGCLSGNDVLVA